MKKLLWNPHSPELEFLKSLWGLGTKEEEGYRTGHPGHIGCRNSFLGIDSGAPYTFKNTGSVPEPERFFWHGTKVQGTAIMGIVVLDWNKGLYYRY
jgi:hypothetical protein